MKTPLSPCWSLLLALLALRAAPALAHNGLPETSNISVRRGSEDDLIVGATFGAVISRDRGQTWRWICPEGMGIGAWRPARYHWLSGGDLLAATGSALVLSKDGGCSWTSHPFFKDTWVTHLAVHPTDERIMYVTTGKNTVANGIYRSDDGGETWRVILPLSTDLRYSAIRIAPSDPRRIYASGQDSTGAMFLSRSDDAGETWTRLPQPLPELVRPYDLLLLLVSEASPDVLWARVSAGGSSYLLKSTDGGTTLTQAMTTADVIIGAEASADGRTVWVSTPVHLYRGREGEAFSELPLPNGNSCALRRGDVLLGCGSSWVHDWAMASSRDEGETWEPIFNLNGIQGAHACPAGTSVQQLCPVRWPQLAELLGAPTYTDGGVEPAPDAGPSGPEGPRPQDGCSATTGLVPAALLLLLLTLSRHSRRQLARRSGS
ncbi:MAG: exo-alpha-sialidase [Myxococcaceae bacterium]|nr:exo-alpha-sialidase [Myxococcaceae bacterium]